MKARPQAEEGSSPVSSMTKGAACRYCYGCCNPTTAGYSSAGFNLGNGKSLVANKTALTKSRVPAGPNTLASAERHTFHNHPSFYFMLPKF